MKKNHKNAIVVSLNEDISETLELALSLGYKTVKTFFQLRDKPDVNSYIGSGKVEEIKEFIENSNEDIDLVIINGEIKPSQWFILEKELNIDVYDRVRLILAIFEQRADRREARLQVKLAQLQYERPFVRELIHRARAGEHPGFMAGGEYQVDDYYEMIKKQMKKIKNELESIRGERELRRRHRHTGGFYLVSLAGYTNAGKSSLLNLLSNEKVKVEGKLFSTLSTTTRKIKNKDLPILLTDTVGFIQDLPAFIINAFHSTLEEIEVADVVILIVDISENIDTMVKKLKVSLDELIDLDVNSPIIIALNKTDLLSQQELLKKIEHIKKLGIVNDKKMIPVSAKTGYNINMLLETIYNALPYLIGFKIKLPVDNETQSFISWIYEKTRVHEVSYNDFVTISGECNIRIHGIICSKCKEFKGLVIQ